MRIICDLATEKHSFITFWSLYQMCSVKLLHLQIKVKMCFFSCSSAVFPLTSWHKIVLQVSSAKFLLVSTVSTEFQLNTLVVNHTSLNKAKPFFKVSCFIFEPEVKVPECEVSCRENMETTHIDSPQLRLMVSLFAFVFAPKFSCVTHFQQFFFLRQIFSTLVANFSWDDIIIQQWEHQIYEDKKKSNCALLEFFFQNIASQYSFIVAHKNCLALFPK